ncbi:alpha/beta hydrolase [Verrucomicrobiaceae bacterium N1E253]|uniref:Alpha/beta hydrolase n=1 Tax=Oceaniferula marina TaxID=2748318 RepID=A0A851GI91_9BACT|nr:alpha/beta hydrolase [Oceaniferula marina]NWK57508.1 alpha/beta hydrolase [Oceaniferula marina]
MPIHSTHQFNMHYEVHQQSNTSQTPVICIMGITAPGSVWEAHVEVWSQQFQCITADNRGVGQSDKPSGDYTSAMMADDYANLMDGLGIQQAHIVGCSMGSIIGQQLAIRHPEKVKSLVLMCSWARCDNYAKSIFSHMQQTKAHLTPAAFMEWIQLLIFHKRSWDDPEMLESMIEGRENAAEDPNPQPLHGLQGQAAACIHHDTLNQLEQIQAPALVIGGAEDIFTPAWMAEEIDAKLSNSTLHLYPESGHAFHWENLEDFNQRVAHFINSNN